MFTQSQLWRSRDKERLNSIQCITVFILLSLSRCIVSLCDTDILFVISQKTKFFEYCDVRFVWGGWEGVVQASHWKVYLVENIYINVIFPLPVKLLPNISAEKWWFILACGLLMVSVKASTNVEIELLLVYLSWLLTFANKSVGKSSPVFDLCLCFINI